MKISIKTAQERQELAQKTYDDIQVIKKEKKKAENQIHQMKIERKTRYLMKAARGKR